MQEIGIGLKIAMFGIGAQNVQQLKNTPYIQKAASP